MLQGAEGCQLSKPILPTEEELARVCFDGWIGNKGDPAWDDADEYVKDMFRGEARYILAHLAPRAAELEQALYLCLQELSYVQEPGCGCKERHLCASGRGRDLIDEGMKLLGVADLGSESVLTARRKLEESNG